ncbi:hypothetical protein HY029_01045 [Candidatus Gottesmanbacteria bacterium]|nr:hypothetical protein [Candidatus Gottesmanbacteria bacterium]
MPKKRTIGANNRKIGLMSLLVLLIISITLIVVNYQKNLKSSVFKTRADEEVTPTPGKRCNVDTSADAAPSCEFYEKCLENFCQYNSNWGGDISPLQVLAIYDRLKTDLGFEIPLLLDKERISRLTDLEIATNFDNPCTGFAGVMMGSSYECNMAYLLDPKYKKEIDRMKISTILRGMYPELSDQDLKTLEKKLREHNSNETPRSSLEFALFQVDILSIPYVVKDLGSLGIKTLSSGSKDLLPKFLGLIKSSGEFTLDKESITALKEISSRSTRRAIGLTSQLQAYLKRIEPYKVIRLGWQNVPLWRSKQVLNPEKWQEFRDALSRVTPMVSERLGMIPEANHVYWTDDIRKIVGNRSAVAVYLDDYKIWILDIREIQKGVVEMVADVVHEKIHYILSQKGVAQYIADLGGRWNSNKYFWNLKAFEEGLTEYLSQYFMRKAGFTYYYTAYEQQVQAVNRLLGGGKYIEIVIDAIRTGDFRYFLNSYRWSTNDLFKWILGHFSPASQFMNLFSVNAASEINQNFPPDYEANIQPNLSYIFNNDPEENLINKATYTLIDETNRIMDENGINEITIEDVSYLKYLVLAASISTNLEAKKYVTTDDIKQISDELDNFSEEKYNPNEYAVELPAIGTDDIPIPSDVSTDNMTIDQDQIEPNITPTYIPFPTFD